MSVKEKQTRVRINRNSLEAVLRVLEEALPLVDAAVFEDELMDDEERRYWAADLEDAQRVVRSLNLSHMHTSWLLMPYVSAGTDPEYDLHV